MRKSKKTSKLRVTGIFCGNLPVTGRFPSQRASDAENVSIWWRHHERCSPGNHPQVRNTGGIAIPNALCGGNSRMIIRESGSYDWEMYLKFQGLFTVIGVTHTDRKLLEQTYMGYIRDGFMHACVCACLPVCVCWFVCFLSVCFQDHALLKYWFIIKKIYLSLIIVAWWRHSATEMVQVIVCCLMASGHYLNPCWLNINQV